MLPFCVTFQYISEGHDSVALSTVTHIGGGAGVGDDAGLAVVGTSGGKGVGAVTVGGVAVQSL